MGDQASYNQPMNELNADLHCHSVVSDGTLEPEALAQRALAGGVQLWSLTDHDELGGQARAREAAQDLGLGYVSGVEISVTFLNKTVHIVGLGMNERDPALVAGLASTRGGRGERAHDMAAGLAKAGIPDAFEGALKYAGNPDLIARTHFARHLVETGVCKNMDEVFRRFLTEGKPGFVAHRWASMREAVRWIVDAGGVAVLAHPGRYGFKGPQEHVLFTEFIAHGGRGVEVITGSHFTVLGMPLLAVLGALRKAGELPA